MLYSVYRGDLFVVSPETGTGKYATGITKYKIGEADSSEDLWFYSYAPPMFPGFIQGADKETEEYLLSHQELLPDCPYAWSPAGEEAFFYWAGEKTTRLYVSASDDQEEALTALGAVKISGAEKNDSGYSLWYYSSDDPGIPAYFSGCRYVWQDSLTDADFYDPFEDTDAEIPEFDDESFEPYDEE